MLMGNPIHETALTCRTKSTIVLTLSHHPPVTEVMFCSPVDISGTFMGEGPVCLLLSWNVVGENPDYVCWEGLSVFRCDSTDNFSQSKLTLLNL